jgi:transposase
MSSVTLHPSDITDDEWQHIRLLLPASKTRGRPREWPLRMILDGIFYLLRSGCAWRMLPKEYPPWPTVHDYFRRWRQDGTLERIHACLREQYRRKSGRNVSPSGAVLDSQSVKTTEKGALLELLLSAMTASRRSKDASVFSSSTLKDCCSKSKL